MAVLTLRSPLSGWVLALADVPDPAFAQGAVGSGVAIDPIDGQLCAPCAGRVGFAPGHRHALSLQAEGITVLVHVGIDTVALGGQGFEVLAAEGEHVHAGQPLLRFDLDFLARHAPSLVTPVLVTEGGRLLRTAPPGPIATGDLLMEIECEPALAGPSVAAGQQVQRQLTVGFAHGLHARPAAQLAAALKPFQAQVVVRAGDRSANARSTAGLMSLGVGVGDRVDATATGPDAEAAIAAFAAVMDAGDAALPATVPPASVPAQPARAQDAGGRIQGLVASRGQALGQAARFGKSMAAPPPHSGSPAREHAALDVAIDTVLHALASALPQRHGAAREITEAHAALLDDPQLRQDAHAAIDAGCSAGDAWWTVVEAIARGLDALVDPRLRERAADLRDVGQQVLGALAGDTATGQALPPDAILLADELLPSQLLALDPARLAGLCTARGGPTSHVAIIAAALGVPALVGAGGDVLAIAAGTPLWLDAERGLLVACDTPDRLADAQRAVAAHRARHQRDLASAADAGRLADGTPVAVLANLGDSEAAAEAVALGAEGCGLLRTEFLFLHRDAAPDEDEQLRHYQRLQDALGARPLVIRTMDVGGDKPLAYLPGPHEDNPALGLRGIRASLARPDLLRMQLRAILRLAGPTPARVLLPMVNDPGELRAVRALLRTCADELALDALPLLGAMVETPAAALQARALLREADFLSIGSNDLAQYVLAIDRGHAQLGAQLDGLHPAVLRLVGEVADAGAQAGKPVAVCGGLASDVHALPLLVGLGVRGLSAVPRRIPELKRALRGLTLEACQGLVQDALACEDAAAVRRLVSKGAAFDEDMP